MLKSWELLHPLVMVTEQVNATLYIPEERAVLRRHEQKAILSGDFSLNTIRYFAFIMKGLINLVACTIGFGVVGATRLDAAKYQ